MRFFFIFLILFQTSYAQTSLGHFKFCIPFSIERNNLKIEAIICSQKLYVLFDTGSHGMEVDSSLRSELQGISKYGISSIAFGDQVLNGQIIRFRNWNKFLSDDIVGMVGPDIFFPLSIEIDFENNVLNFYDSSFQPASPYSKLNLTKIDTNIQSYNFLSIPIELELGMNGRQKGEFIFDTGSSRNLTIFTNDIKGLSGIKQQRLNASPHGLSNTVNIKSQNLKVQDYDLPNLWVDYTEVSKDHSNQSFTGIAGYGVLRNFNFFLNYTNDQFYYYRNNNEVVKFITDGIMIRDYRMQNKGLRLGSVINDGRYFNNAHLRLNDEIISIEFQGKRITFENYLELKKVIGNSFNITLKRKLKKIRIQTKVYELT